MRRFIVSMLALPASMMFCSAAFAGPDTNGICGPDTSLFLLSDGASDLPATCTAPHHSTPLIEALYYQNASSVGGTALAAYPMLRVRAGIFTRTELVVDAPAQVAESGLAGAGLYPRSSPGFGLNTTFIETQKDAATFHFEALPPVSRFAANQTLQVQSRYLFGVTSLHRINERLTLNGLLSASTSRISGFNNLFPSAAVAGAWNVTPRTELTLDVGTRYIVRHAWPQSFGDFSAAHMIGRKALLDVGLGTTFNPTANSKSHYLAAGVSYKP